MRRLGNYVVYTYHGVPCTMHVDHVNICGVFLVSTFAGSM